MKHIKLFEEFINESINNRNLKEIEKGLSFLLKYEKKFGDFSFDFNGQDLYLFNNNITEDDTESDDSLKNIEKFGFYWSETDQSLIFSDDNKMVDLLKSLPLLRRIQRKFGDFDYDGKTISLFNSKISIENIKSNDLKFLNELGFYWSETDQSFDFYL